MGFKSGGDNKETLTIQAPDGEKSNLILKSDVSCFIRLEADTDNDNADETQNPYIEFVGDGGFTDFSLGLNSTRQKPGGGLVLASGTDNSLSMGSNLAQDTDASSHIQFYCRTTASVGFYDRGSTNHGPADRQGYRVGIGPIFNESRFPEARCEIHNTEDSPVPSLYLSTSGSAQHALVITAANTNTPIIAVSGSALVNGAVLKAQVGSNGSAIALKVKHTTGTASGTTTQVANAIPANASIIAFGIRVTTGYDAHITQIGVNGDADFFVAVDPVVGAPNVLADGVLEQAGDTIVVPTQVANNNFIANTSDQALVLTHGSTAQGAVRVATYFYEITPPTS